MANAKRQARPRPPVDQAFRRQTRSRATQPGASPLRAGIPSSGRPDGSLLPGIQQPSGVQQWRVRGAGAQPAQTQSTRRQPARGQPTRKQSSRKRLAPASPAQTPPGEVENDAIQIGPTTPRLPAETSSDPSQDEVIMLEANHQHVAPGHDREEDSTPVPSHKRGRVANDEDAAESSSSKRARRQTDSPVMAISPSSSLSVTQRSSPSSSIVEFVKEIKIKKEDSSREFDVGTTSPEFEIFEDGANAQPETPHQHADDQAILPFVNMELQPNRPLGESVVQPRVNSFEFSIHQDDNSQASTEIGSQASPARTNSERRPRRPLEEIEAQSGTPLDFDIRGDHHVRPRTPSAEIASQPIASLADPEPQPRGGTIPSFEIHQDTREQHTPPQQRQDRAPFTDIGPHSGRTLGELEDQNGLPLGSVGHPPRRRSSSEFNIHLDIDGRQSTAPGQTQPSRSISPEFHVILDENGPNPFESPPRRPQIHRDLLSAPRQTLGEVEVQRRSTSSEFGIYHDAVEYLDIFNDAENQPGTPLGEVGAQQRRTVSTEIEIAVDEKVPTNPPYSGSRGPLGEIAPLVREVLREVGGPQRSANVGEFDIAIDEDDNEAAANQLRRELAESFTQTLEEAQPRQALGEINAQPLRTSTTGADVSRDETDQNSFNNQPRRPLGSFMARPRPSLEQIDKDSDINNSGHAVQNQPETQQDIGNLGRRTIHPGFEQSASQPRVPLGEIGGEPGSSPSDYHSVMSKEDDENQPPAAPRGHNDHQPRNPASEVWPQPSAPLGDVEVQPRLPLGEIGGEVSSSFSELETISEKSSDSSEFHVREDDENLPPVIPHNAENQPRRRRREFRQQPGTALVELEVLPTMPMEEIGDQFNIHQDFYQEQRSSIEVQAGTRGGTPEITGADQENIPPQPRDAEARDVNPGGIDRGYSMPSTAVPSIGPDGQEQQRILPGPESAVPNDAGPGQKKKTVMPAASCAPAAQHGSSDENEESTQSTLRIGTPVTMGPPSNSRGTDSASTIIQTVETPSPSDDARPRHPGQENIPPQASSSNSESGPVTRGPFSRDLPVPDFTAEPTIKSESDSQEVHVVWSSDDSGGNDKENAGPGMDVRTSSQALGEEDPERGNDENVPPSSPDSSEYRGYHSCTVSYVHIPDTPLNLEVPLWAWNYDLYGANNLGRDTHPQWREESHKYGRECLRKHGCFPNSNCRGPRGAFGCSVCHNIWLSQWDAYFHAQAGLPEKANASGPGSSDFDPRADYIGFLAEDFARAPPTFERLHQTEEQQARPTEVTGLLSPSPSPGPTEDSQISLRDVSRAVDGNDDDENGG